MQLLTQTHVAINQTMILATEQRPHALRFYRNRRGRLRLKVDAKSYPAKRSLIFSIEGARCHIRIKDLGQCIAFAMNGTTKLLLVVPQENTHE